MTDITTLDITPEEVRTGRITPVHLSAATRALRDDGIIVLNDIVSMDHIAALREKMLHDLPAYLARTDAPFNFNTGNVQQEPPPFAVEDSAQAMRLRRLPQQVQRDDDAVAERLTQCRPSRLQRP